MIEVEETILIDAPPDVVWATGGDVGGLASWIETIEACRMEGDLRHITLTSGNTVVERIVARSDEERFYEYEFVEGALPLAKYRSRFRIEPDGDVSQVIWHADLEASPPDQTEAVAASIKESYRKSLASLRALHGDA
jgi:uncharacterized membrane protein